MKTLFFLTALAWAGAANAACYVDYKAKQDSPLRLHYGVAQISGDCTLEASAIELEPKLEDAGWQLLTVMDIFDETGLDGRKESAGEYFLRF